MAAAFGAPAPQLELPGGSDDMESSKTASTSAVLSKFALISLRTLIIPSEQELQKYLPSTHNCFGTESQFVALSKVAGEMRTTWENGDMVQRIKHQVLCDPESRELHEDLAFFRLLWNSQFNDSKNIHLEGIMKVLMIMKELILSAFRDDGELDITMVTLLVEWTIQFFERYFLDAWISARGGWEIVLPEMIGESPKTTGKSRERRETEGDYLHNERQHPAYTDESMYGLETPSSIHQTPSTARNHDFQSGENFGHSQNELVRGNEDSWRNVVEHHPRARASQLAQSLYHRRNNNFQENYESADTGEQMYLQETKQEEPISDNEHQGDENQLRVCSYQPKPRQTSASKISYSNRQPKKSSSLHRREKNLSYREKEYKSSQSERDSYNQSDSDYNSDQQFQASFQDEKRTTPQIQRLSIIDEEYNSIQNSQAPQKHYQDIPTEGNSSESDESIDSENEQMASHIPQQQIKESRKQLQQQTNEWSKQLSYATQSTKAGNANMTEESSDEDELVETRTEGSQTEQRFLQPRTPSLVPVKQRKLWLQRPVNPPQQFEREEASEEESAEESSSESDNRERIQAPKRFGESKSSPQSLRVKQNVEQNPEDVNEDGVKIKSAGTQTAFTDPRRRISSSARDGMNFLNRRSSATQNVRPNLTLSDQPNHMFRRRTGSHTILSEQVQLKPKTAYALKCNRESSNTQSENGASDRLINRQRDLANFTRNPSSFNPCKRRSASYNSNKRNHDQHMGRYSVSGSDDQQRDSSNVRRQSEPKTAYALKCYKEFHGMRGSRDESSPVSSQRRSSFNPCRRSASYTASQPRQQAAEYEVPITQTDLSRGRQLTSQAGYDQRSNIAAGIAQQQNNVSQSAYNYQQRSSNDTNRIRSASYGNEKAMRRRKDLFGSQEREYRRLSSRSPNRNQFSSKPTSYSPDEGLTTKGRHVTYDHDEQTDRARQKVCRSSPNRPRSLSPQKRRDISPAVYTQGVRRSM